MMKFLVGELVVISFCVFATYPCSIFFYPLLRTTARSLIIVTLMLVSSNVLDGPSLFAIDILTFHTCIHVVDYAHSDMLFVVFLTFVRVDEIGLEIDIVILNLMLKNFGRSLSRIRLRLRVVRRP